MTVFDGIKRPTCSSCPYWRQPPVRSHDAFERQDPQHLDPQRVIRDAVGSPRGDCRRRSPDHDREPAIGRAEWYTTYAEDWCGDHPLMEAMVSRSLTQATMDGAMAPLREMLEQLKDGLGGD